MTMTYNEAKSACATYGCSMRAQPGGDFRVAPRHLHGAAQESAAYYTNDLDDAVATARAMYEARSTQQLANGVAPTRR